MDTSPPLHRTPFARLFHQTRTPHRFEARKTDPFAYNHTDDLSICARCGGGEGALLSTCPIQRMTFAEMDIAYGVFCEKTRIQREEAIQCCEMGVQFAGLWEPTIAEYNEAARRFNDNLIDITLKQRQLESADHHTLVLA